jgi:transposase
MIPQSLDEHISYENPIRVIDAFVNQLDLIKLEIRFAVAPRIGRSPYDPKDIIKLYIYGYLNGIRSSRKLEKETNRNIEVMWLLNGLTPDFKTIADFRKDNKKGLKHIFREFARLCDEWGLYGKTIVAIDGSKFRANNSKKNNFSPKKIERHLKYLDDKINSYMDSLDENDTEEANDKKLSAEEINKRIQELQNRKIKYEEYKKELEETDQTEISTTDPDARLMSNNNNSVEVSYNVQTSVDSEHKLILDFKVTQKPNDLGELDNMALRAKKLLKGKKFKILADKGFYKARDLKKCVSKEITPYVAKQTYSNGTGDKDYYNDKFIFDKEKNIYICPAGKELYYAGVNKKDKKVIAFKFRNYKACKECECKSNCTKSTKGRTISRHIDQDFLDTIDLQTEENFELYKLRQMIVEHPFGTIKRSWNAYYFLTRGKVSVTAEIALSYLAYNLKRAINIIGVKQLVTMLEERQKPALV